MYLDFKNFQDSKIILQNLIENQEKNRNEDLSRIVADKYCVTILKAIDKEPKSVVQLSSECDIFVGLIYRRLKLLQKNGLLDMYGEIRPDGKKFFLYKSLVNNITVSFNGNDLKITFTLKGKENLSDDNHFNSF